MTAAFRVTTTASAVVTHADGTTDEDDTVVDASTATDSTENQEG